MAVAANHLRLVTSGFARAAGAPVALPAARPAKRTEQRPPIGQLLLDMRAVSPENLLHAVALRNRQDLRLGDILLSRGWISEDDLLQALSRQWDVPVANLRTDPPDPRLLDHFGAEVCLHNAIIPWRKAGSVTVIATARPDDFARVRRLLPADAGPYAMAVASEQHLNAAIVAARQTRMIRLAETRVPDHESCRSLDRRLGGRLALALIGILAATCALSPTAAFLLLLGWACLTLCLCMGLKAAAFASQLRADLRRHPAPGPPKPMAQLPVVSVMVPLFEEDDITTRLVRRLGRITYPKELTDILLVVEEEDHITRAALMKSSLPCWMRVVIVPHGPIRTKPRALNYALEFCHGSIIGIYDAEDAPEPDQLHKVVRRFSECGPDVACLQGVLDYYNAGHNWLTRCFTIEYAAWFRVMLPGLARLGFVVPLGGTTLFFRRRALEALGAWDAHNVTEDADLGLRLARHGYRTELIPTVTEEEPNSRVLPWIRQRSRWLKGYAMTWAVHSRNPVRLWRDLGPKGFVGMQILFLGTLSQFVLAPVLWSFWLLTLGHRHPFAASVPAWAFTALAVLFVLSECLNIAVGLWAVRGRKHRFLIPWVPTLQLYFPLGALASYKALWEAVRQPFFWDKTHHGLLNAADETLPAQAADLPMPDGTEPAQALNIAPLWPDQERALPPRTASGFAFAPDRAGIQFQARLERL